MLLVSLNSRQIAGFYYVYIFPEMNNVLLYIPVVLFCAYAAKKGIAAIAKLNLYAVAIMAFTIIVNFLLLLGNMDFSNFLPVFETPAGLFVKSTLIISSINYCEICSFMFVTPYAENTEKLGKMAVAGLLISALLYLIIVVQNTAVIGASLGIYQESSYKTVRLIHIGEFLTRMELLTALSDHDLHVYQDRRPDVHLVKGLCHALPTENLHPADIALLRDRRRRCADIVRLHRGRNGLSHQISFFSRVSV